MTGLEQTASKCTQASLGPNCSKSHCGGHMHKDSAARNVLFWQGFGMAALCGTCGDHISTVGWVF